MKEFKNKNCLISGAASGIGRSFALALAKKGMNLFITDINEDGLEKVKTEIEELGTTIYSDMCDVSKLNDIENAAKIFYSKFGDVDLLINNAGIGRPVNLANINLENWKDILEVKGVNKDKVVTNNIHEIASILGIEAARQAVINEVKKVINQQGLDIDKRHIKLIADAMTYKGSTKGVTRMGIISEKSSILARASFETPVKQFINATIKGSRDELASVIENIILNQPVPVGTGLPGLLVKVTGPLVKKTEKVKKVEKKEVVKKISKEKTSVKK